MAKFQIGNSTKKSNKTQSFINRQPKDRSGSSDLELAVYSEPDAIIVGGSVDGNPGLYSDYDIAGASGNDEIIVSDNVDYSAGSYDAAGGTDVVIHGTSGHDEITGYSSDDEKRAGVLGGIRAHNVKRGDQRVGSVNAKRTRRFEKMSLDPVGWFTKDDALAVQKGLESQLGSVDPSDLPFAEVKSFLFATATDSLPSIF